MGTWLSSCRECVQRGMREPERIRTTPGNVNISVAGSETRLEKTEEPHQRIITRNWCPRNQGLGMSVDAEKPYNIKTGKDPWEVTLVRAILMEFSTVACTQQIFIE